MAKSIMQEEKECYLCRELLKCKNSSYLEEHHLYFGNPKRQLSERHGLKVWLCLDHHRGFRGVHQNRTLDLWLKAQGQKAFELTNTREEFMAIFGRSYL